MLMRGRDSRRGLISKSFPLFGVGTFICPVNKLRLQGREPAAIAAGVVFRITASPSVSTGLQISTKVDFGISGRLEGLPAAVAIKSAPTRIIQESRDWAHTMRAVDVRDECSDDDWLTQGRLS